MRYPRVVYVIKHEPTGRVYVGSSHDPHERFRGHFNSLKGGYHNNKSMQADCDKYGFSYSVYILDTIQGIDDKNKEFLWMDALNARAPDTGYNILDKSKPHISYLEKGFSITSTDDVNLHSFKTWVKKRTPT